MKCKYLKQHTKKAQQAQRYEQKRIKKEERNKLVNNKWTNTAEQEDVCTR